MEEKEKQRKILVVTGTWDAGLVVVHASKCGPLDFEETACKHDQEYYY